jgi:iron complex transport system substrate-binding protein
VNAFPDVDGWGIITLERLLTADPEIIIVDSGVGMGESGYDVLRNSFYQDPRLQSLSAVQNNQVYTMDADIIDRGGPRIADCVEQLSGIIHPEIFGDPAPAADTAAAPGFGVFACAVCGLVFLGRRLV